MTDVPSPSGSNFTPYQRQLLQQARATLHPKKDSIVGVLIADDGRQFPFASGGGQGFSSHIEGKATAAMVEFGIKKATLIVELEPCQLCDRSDYPAATGPEAPLKSTATGKELTRQTSKINSDLPIGYELDVVGPESTGIYRGTKSASTNPAPRGLGPASTPETQGEPRARPALGSSMAGKIGGAGTDIILSLIFDLIGAKIKEYLDRKEYEKKLLGLEPKIKEKKGAAYYTAMAQFGSQELGRLYYNIQIQVTVKTIIVIAGAGSRNISLAPNPELLSVIISNANINRASAVNEKFETAPGGHAVAYTVFTQFLTYSEPVVPL